jgi:hypothetical protein
LVRCLGTLSWYVVLVRCLGTLSWYVVLVRCLGTLSWYVVLVRYHNGTFVKISDIIVAE